MAVVEIFVMLLTPLSIYRILRLFNVDRALSTLASMTYTVLLLYAFKYLMLALGALVVALGVLIAVLVAKRGRSSRPGSTKVFQ